MLMSLTNIVFEYVDTGEYDAVIVNENRVLIGEIVLYGHYIYHYCYLHNLQCITNTILLGLLHTVDSRRRFKSNYKCMNIGLFTWLSFSRFLHNMWEWRIWIHSFSISNKNLQLLEYRSGIQIPRRNLRKWTRRDCSLYERDKMYLLQKRLTPDFLMIFDSNVNEHVRNLLKNWFNMVELKRFRHSIKGCRGWNLGDYYQFRMHSCIYQRKMYML